MLHVACLMFNAEARFGYLVYIVKQDPFPQVPLKSRTLITPRVSMQLQKKITPQKNASVSRGLD